MVSKRFERFTSALALPAGQAQRALLAVATLAILFVLADTMVGAASSGTSVNEAQKLVKFSILEPTSLPNEFNSQTLTATTYHVGTSSSDQANYVTLYYSANQPAQQQGIVVVETTDSSAVPAIDGDTATFVSPLSPDGALQTVSVMRGTEAKMGIAGVIVTSFGVVQAYTRQTYVVWKHRGVSSYIEAADTTGVSEGELQLAAASIISQRKSPPLLPAGLTTFAFAILNGLVLTFALVIVYRLRRTMLWARALFVILALFGVFLLVDGIVTGPYFIDVGRVLGAALVLAGMLLYGRRLKPTLFERPGSTAHG